MNGWTQRAVCENNKQPNQTETNPSGLDPHEMNEERIDGEKKTM